MADYSIERIALEMGGDPSIPGLYARKEYIKGLLADVSTGETVSFLNKLVGAITKFTTYLEGTLTIADATVKLQINAVDVTGGGVTVEYDGSAAGDIDETVPTALNILAANDLISVVGGGESTDAQKLWFEIEVTQYEA